MKEYFEKKFGQGTAFDLDYGKIADNCFIDLYCIFKIRKI